MTDRIHSFVVVLDKEIREDDAEATIQAIRQIKNVIKVIPQIATVDHYVAKSQARYELQNKLWKMFEEDKK